MEFKKHVLDNGLTIIGEISPTAQSAAIGFFTKTGARDETPEISGVSHFLEHMMFKGTDELSALEVNEAFDRIGAKFNAFTSEENTVYYAAVLPEYMGEVTTLWSKLMRPSLRDDDFNIEKNVIKEEIAMYQDLPQFDVMDKAKALHFAPHPCGNSVLGTTDSIDALTADQMRTYFADRYEPGNIVAACCGNFDFDQVCTIINDLCGSWQNQNAQRPTTFTNGTLISRRETKPTLVREHICLMSPMVSMQDERRYAGSLLGMIMGDETGSRMFWALVDSAMAEVACSQFESMDGVGAMYSYIRCNPDKAEDVMEEVKKVFAELVEKGITEDELDTAKNKVLSALTIRNEQPMGRLVGLGFNWVYLNEYRSMADNVAAVKAITVDDVNALLREFNPSNFTMYSLGPQNGDGNQ